MKNIFKLMALFAFVLCFASCDDDEKVEIPALPVTAANLNGTCNFLNGTDKLWQKVHIAI